MTGATPDRRAGTTRRFAREERADLADFLDTLTAEEWDAPTLCAGWRVRDVVAHAVSYDELTVRGVLTRMARARFRPHGANAIGLAEYAGRDPKELVRLLRAHLDPRGLPAAFGGMIALVDGLIHHQDIRRPLGRPRAIPGERLRHTLRLALLAPPIGAFRRARGLRLVATDVDWASGTGPEVRGPGEAVLMAAAGRADALPELTGPGVPTLTARVTH
ncbi:TIGR03083 family protein [Amycolatopsis arida]|uniref:TIGR03083 family protein n=1 Tax=Amycolatopsis arida TaxID=587909 RepID=A0A1I5YH05_9PSEU|nr:maleylpyruvate isomerase family mycothiol-dependent enzyme [Amycolatopsis arida]TDX90510.1 uncharacterized protein (TIGR03083 family) [Amycolatopsis arida]SFQ43511.1 TIGR03083 family protein [Amycolatopsis arida]